MQSRFLKTLLLAAVIVGGVWILVNRDKIQNPGDVVGMLKDNLTVQQIGYQGQGSYQVPVYSSSPIHPNNYPPNTPVQINREPQFVTNVIRIASFKLNKSITNTNQPNHALDLLADICRRYDAIAFQEIDASENAWLARLTDRMNSMGATGTAGAKPELFGENRNEPTTNYSFISDRDKNPGLPTQSAIVFNRRTLELDQSQWYTVNDPDGVLTRKPTVAWFRARGPAPNQALTFSLVNLKIDGRRSERELAHLAELFRAIRNDGRGEDDVLIVGDFNAGDRGLQPIRKMAGLTWVVSNTPTDTKHQSQFDNLVFSEMATVEFTGRGGVFDFMRHYNLMLDDALKISEHMPVWAEFSIFEGVAQKANTVEGTPGRVAGGNETPAR